MSSKVKYLKIHENLRALPPPLRWKGERGGDNSHGVGGGRVQVPNGTLPF